MVTYNIVDIKSGVTTILFISYTDTNSYDKNSKHPILREQLACARVIGITM